MNNICIFCGGSNGKDPSYIKLAQQVGGSLAQNGYGIVYGAGGFGLMGAVAQSALDAGGQVTGVIPHHLVNKEKPSLDLSELILVESMSERKIKMADMSKAFVVLPGGLGTLDELAELWTWKVLDLHDDPVILLNANNFYDKLLAFLDYAAQEGFISAEHLQKLICVTTVDELLTALESRI